MADIWYFSSQMVMVKRWRCKMIRTMSIYLSIFVDFVFMFICSMCCSVNTICLDWIFSWIDMGLSFSFIIPANVFGKVVRLFWNKMLFATKFKRFNNFNLPITWTLISENRKIWGNRTLKSEIKLNNKKFLTNGVFWSLFYFFVVVSYP